MTAGGLIDLDLVEAAVQYIVEGNRERQDGNFELSSDGKAGGVSGLGESWPSGVIPEGGNSSGGWEMNGWRFILGE